MFSTKRPWTTLFFLLTEFYKHKDNLIISSLWSMVVGLLLQCIIYNSTSPLKREKKEKKKKRKKKEPSKNNQIYEIRTWSRYVKTRVKNIIKIWESNERISPTLIATVSPKFRLFLIPCTKMFLLCPHAVVWLNINNQVIFWQLWTLMLEPKDLGVAPKIQTHRLINKNN